MNKTIPVFVLLTIVLSINVIPNAHAFSCEKSTNNETLIVRLETEPENPEDGESTKLNIEFINPMTKKNQEHVDYTIKIENNGNEIFGPIPLTHTSPGSVSIPVTLENGKNVITIDVEGILFQPIPKEVVSCDVIIGEMQENNTEESKEKPDPIDDGNPKEDDAFNQDSSSIIPGWIKTNAGWWANDEIDDETFVSGIQFLITEGVISVSSSSSSSSNGDDDNTVNGIPQWIKNNAEWWSQEMISDDDFLKGIEFLVENGIVIV